MNPTRSRCSAVGASLYRRFLTECRGNPEEGKVARRTVGEITERAEDLQDAHNSEASRQEEAERKRRETAATASRAKHLDSLAGLQPETWNNVDSLVASTKPKAYDLAVTLLTDLRDLALQSGDGPRFYERLAVVRDHHARKPSFIARLDKAGLSEGTP